MDCGDAGCHPCGNCPAKGQREACSRVCRRLAGITGLASCETTILCIELCKTEWLRPVAVQCMVVTKTPWLAERLHKLLMCCIASVAGHCNAHRSS